MDPKRPVAFASPTRPTTRTLPPFGGLGFDFCGLGRACARLPLHRPAPREAQRPAQPARA